jgi:hypothetical protein
MTCQELRQQIHDFLDGELPPRDFAAFNVHVKQCAGCQRYHDEFSWLKSALAVERLSQSAQEMLWKRVRLRVERNWKTRILELGDLLRTCLAGPGSRSLVVEANGHTRHSGSLRYDSDPVWTGQSS